MASSGGSQSSISCEARLTLGPTKQDIQASSCPRTGTAPLPIHRNQIPLIVVSRTTGQNAERVVVVLPRRPVRRNAPERRYHINPCTNSYTLPFFS